MVGETPFLEVHELLHPSLLLFRTFKIGDFLHRYAGLRVWRNWLTSFLKDFAYSPVRSLPFA
jgi:hypothetical protein